MRQIALVGVAFLVLVVAACQATTTPVIGVLDQPSDDGTYDYIAASYVKFLESAGARVVPIRNTGNATYFHYMFSSLNGLLIPGGNADITSADASYRVATQSFLKDALTAAGKGDYFPIWGTCLGFELLAILIAEDNTVLEGEYDSWNLALPLNLTQQAMSGRMFADGGLPLLQILKGQAVTMNNHHFGVRPAMFAQNAKLADFFHVLSTNMDLRGKPFVSTIEAKKYPVYGVQWHPEKNNYEWTQTGTSHTKEAVLVSQAMANFMVSEARKSNHGFAGGEKELDKYLIYHHDPERTYGSFEQTYKWTR